MDRHRRLDLFGLNSALLDRLAGADLCQCFAKSLQIALVSTLVCLLIGYPAAYIPGPTLQEAPQRQQQLLLFLFVMPMWMNALLRTYAWLAMLEPKGIINTLLGYLGVRSSSSTTTSVSVWAWFTIICRSWFCRSIRCWSKSVRA
jgi:spermidine/putrescine transport system permease protein